MCRKTNNNNKNKKTRLRCHLVKISDERTLNKLFLGTSVRKGRAGRQKLTCLGCTENNLKSMDVKRWSEQQKTEEPI
jgi:hypothetical protein